MQKHFSKFRKVFINLACSPLILALNNSELAARYLSDDFEKSITNLEIENIYKDICLNISSISKCSSESCWMTIQSLMKESEGSAPGEKPQFLGKKFHFLIKYFYNISHA